MVEQRPGAGGAPRELKYLDPSYYVLEAGETELPSEYECVICNGVVLDPIECTGCQFLYCSECIPRQDMECPRRCGAKRYTNVNRLVLR